MRLVLTGLLRQCLGILAAASFAATGPGLAGFEVLGHLSGIIDLAHERQPHFEEAGRNGHADECQLGTAAIGVRLPTLGAPAIPLVEDRAVETCSAAFVVPSATPLGASLPRAPPA